MNRAQYLPPAGLSAPPHSPATLHTCQDLLPIPPEGKQSRPRLLESFRIYFPPCVAFPALCHGCALCSPDQAHTAGGPKFSQLVSGRINRREARAPEAQRTTPSLCPAVPCVSEAVD